MNITVKSVASKLFVAFVAASMLVMLATPAKAATAEELQAQIDALMAQIAALKGGTTAPAATPAAGCTFTRALTVGAQGEDVKCLQTYLTPTYFTNAGGATGYFGPVTAAAVAAWQTANGVTPAAGYFGPVSQAKYTALMAAAPTTPSTDDSDDTDDTTSGTLGDDEGSITVSGASADESTLEENQEGGVLAFDVDVEGDVEIDRIDVYAAENDTNVASADAEDYFVRAFLMVDGDEVASVDVEDWNQDDYDVLGLTAADDYRIRFSNLGLVFADGDEPEMQVGFEVVGNVDSNDLDADWDVEADEIRFVDGKGFSDTEVANQNETFGLDMEETADLKIKASSDNPEATTLKIEDGDDQSDEYEVFTFDLQEKNGVDVTVDDLRFTLTTTGEGDEAKVIDEAILYVDGDEVGSESVPTGGVVDFEDLGIEVGGDDSVEVTLALVFNGSDDAGLASDVKAEVTSVRKAEDANGNDETEFSLSGEGLDSETFTLRTVVPTVTDTSFSNDRNENGSAGTISFEFTIGAEDDDFDFNVANKAAVNGATDDVRFTVTGTDTGIATAAITKVSGDATSDASGWVIADGDEATFVVDVTFTTANAGDNGTYRVNVSTIGGIEIDETSTGMVLAFVA